MTATERSSREPRLRLAPRDPVRIRRRLVISVNVSDFGAALEWYGKALGFELVYRMDDYGWGEVRTPQRHHVGLGQTEELKHGGTVPT